MPSSLSSKLCLRAVWGLPHGRIIKNSVLVALFILLSFGFTMAAASNQPAAAAGLKDTQGHWAASEIAKAVADGCIKGYPDGTFRPNAGVSRAELAAMLNRALAVAPGQDTHSFKDVRSQDWFAADVKTALSAGYVSGYPDGTFQPQKPVNRQEATCFLAQLLKLDEIAALNFSDASKIATWAKPSVGRLVSRGIMAGYPDGAFQPLRVISRAEAVVMINRALAISALTPAQVQLQVVDDPVNVRTGPSRLYSVIGQVRAGDILQAKAKSGGNWYQIAYQGGTGWIAGQCVQVVPVQSQPPAPSTPEPESDNSGQLSVQVKQGSNGVTVDLTGAQGGSYQWVEEKNPQRLLITVPGVTAVHTPMQIDLGQGGIDRAITRFPGSAPGTAEVEIDFTALPALLDYQDLLVSSGELQIIVPPQIYKAEAAMNGASLDVSLWATAPLSYQGSRLDSPPRRIFDFSNFYLNSSLKGWQQQINNIGIDCLRLGQYQPGTARLVAETSSPVAISATSTSGGQQMMLRFKQPQVSGSAVVLDPGHGGDDSGAVGPHGLLEKDVNLAISLKVAGLLRQQGVNVTMTRSSDVSVGLDVRPKIANSIPADLFVSIHANASDKPSMGGTGSYTYAPPGTPLGQMRDDRLRLAQDLQNRMCANLGLRNAGVYEDNFEVLRETNMPAALVEVAFISNPAEEKLLSDPNFQQQAAVGISQGIIDYLGGN